MAGLEEQREGATASSECRRQNELEGKRQRRERQREKRPSLDEAAQSVYEERVTGLRVGAFHLYQDRAHFGRNTIRPDGRRTKLRFGVVFGSALTSASLEAMSWEQCSTQMGRPLVCHSACLPVSLCR